MAAYLHTRAGYGGEALARFFKVRRTTAYGRIRWYESLPEGLREGIVAFLATQVPTMAACRLKKEYASPCLEFLAKLTTDARRGLVCLAAHRLGASSYKPRTGKMSFGPH